MTAQPVIVSFVLRLHQVVDEAAESSRLAWRISARHVQTGEEAQFTDLHQACGLIQRWADEAVAGEAKRV